MTELQEKLLEIYKEFKRVCCELKVKHFAAYGTLLGAIRHNGFIPWDDDIDIFMLREDFDYFKDNAPKIIDKKFFVQCHETEHGWWNMMMKIRDNETTAIEKYYSNAKFNQGLWIDIFPVDKIPNDEKIIKKTDRKKHILVRRLRMDYKLKTTKKGKMFNFLIKICIPSKKHAYKELNRLSTRFNKQDLTTYFTICDRTDFLFNQSFFEKSIEVPFENTTMPVFADYKNMLKKMYGDWETLPPLNKRNSGAHEISLLDLNSSYKNYMK